MLTLKYSVGAWEFVICVFEITNVRNHFNPRSSLLSEWRRGDGRADDAKNRQEVEESPTMNGR
jgi:hypothetical protein